MNESRINMETYQGSLGLSKPIEDTPRVWLTPSAYPGSSTHTHTHIHTDISVCPGPNFPLQGRQGSRSSDGQYQNRLILFFAAKHGEALNS